MLSTSVKCKWLQFQVNTEVEVNGNRDTVWVRNRWGALYEAFSLWMLQQCHIWAKDKLHWIYMAHKVCQTVVHVWQSMKTCHKRKAKKNKRTENLVDVWLCVPRVSEKEPERGEGCTICAFIMHIFGGLTGIIVGSGSSSPPGSKQLKLHFISFFHSFSLCFIFLLFYGPWPIGTSNKAIFFFFLA